MGDGNERKSTKRHLRRVLMGKPTKKAGELKEITSVELEKREFYSCDVNLGGENEPRAKHPA